MLCQYGHSKECQHQSCAELREAIEAVIHQGGSTGSGLRRQRLASAYSAIP